MTIANMQTVTSTQGSSCGANQSKDPRCMDHRTKIHCSALFATHPDTSLGILETWSDCKNEFPKEFPWVFWGWNPTKKWHQKDYSTTLLWQGRYKAPSCTYTQMLGTCEATSEGARSCSSQRLPSFQLVQKHSDFFWKREDASTTVRIEQLRY